MTAPFRFPPPTDSEWQAYLDKIDAQVRGESKPNRIVTVAAIWLCVFVVGYFGLRFLAAEFGL